MFLFFYGEDTYSIKQKVLALRQRFQKDNNALFNHVKLDGAKLTKAVYLEAVLSVPFLMESKLVEINNLLSQNSDNNLKKFVAENIDKIPKTTVVLFIEDGLPDARLALFKILNKPKTAQKFLPLDKLALKRWVRNKFDAASINTSDGALEKLGLAVGSDLWRMENEITKLASFCQSCQRQTVEVSDIDLLVSSASEAKIFDFIDLLARKDKKKAVLMLDELRKSGENGIYILTMITYQFRNALSIADLKLTGANDQEIIKTTKIHPYVYRKMQQLLKLFSFNDLVQIYLLLEKTDYEIKRGKIDPGLALDLLTVSICTAKTVVALQ